MLICKNLEKIGRKWVTGTTTSDFQCCAGLSVKLLFWVLPVVSWCLIVVTIHSCCQLLCIINPAGLE